MKLYTEKQVLNMLRSFHNLEMNVQLCMLKLTPIELPSNEEMFNESIKIMEEWYGSGCETEIDAHFRGAKWMRDQILKQQ